MLSRIWNTRWRTILCVLTCLAALAGCTGFTGQNKRVGVSEICPGILAGYLSLQELPDSLALLPPPPAVGSAAFALDEAISRKSLALCGSSRWDLAAQDAYMMFPQAAGTFSCALGIPITDKGTPHLYALLRRTLADAYLSTFKARQYYNRIRPFMVNGGPTCAPGEEELLRKDGSYPSGHAAFGWAWALILSEIAPEQTNALIARGRAFGESRVICNAHWHSDVVEGRFMGAATVARLHADPTFRADLEAARAEVAAARARGLKPTGDCRAEAHALVIH